MSKNPDNGKYVLENNLRTWSQLKRERKEKAAKQDPQRRNTLSDFLGKSADSPTLPPRRWGGCADGCNHANDRYPRRTAQKKKQIQQELQLPPPAEEPQTASNEGDDHPIAPVELSTKNEPPIPTITTNPNGATPGTARQPQLPFRPSVPSYLYPGRDGGGTASGATTPHEMSEDEGTGYLERKGRSLAKAMLKAPQRKATPEDIERWAKESGMGTGKQADALGDEPEDWSDEHRSSMDAKERESNGVDEIEEAEMEDRSLRGSVY